MSSISGAITGISKCRWNSIVLQQYRISVIGYTLWTFQGTTVKIKCFIFNMYWPHIYSCWLPGFMFYCPSVQALGEHISPYRRTTSNARPCQICLNVSESDVAEIWAILWHFSQKKCSLRSQQLGFDSRQDHWDFSSLFPLAERISINCCNRR